MARDDQYRRSMKRTNQKLCYQEMWRFEMGLYRARTEGDHEVGMLLLPRGENEDGKAKNCPGNDHEEQTQNACQS